MIKHGFNPMVFRRMVKDSMLTNNLKPSAVSVTLSLLKFLEKKKSKPTQKREKLQKVVASLSKSF